MRRFAMTTLTVAAGLVALAPVASASAEGSTDPGGATCAYEGDDATALAVVPEDNPANALAQAPVGDSIIFERCGGGAGDPGTEVVPVQR